MDARLLNDPSTDEEESAEFGRGGCLDSNDCSGVSIVRSPTPTATAMRGKDSFIVEGLDSFETNASFNTAAEW